MTRSTQCSDPEPRTTKRSGLLNAGHRKGAVAGRCVVRGVNIVTEELAAYCAVALAGLDDMPDTIMSRSVVVRMRRRSPNEVVEPFRPRLHAPDGYVLRDALYEWSEDTPISGWPTMPLGVEDRDADVWEALLAVADAAGGRWPDRARCAAVTLVTATKSAPPSLGVRLLEDIRDVFTEAQEDIYSPRTSCLHSTRWRCHPGEISEVRP